MNINSTKLFEKEKNILKFQKKIEHSLKKEKNFNLVGDVLNSIKLDNIETISDLNIYFIKSLSKIIFKEEKNFSLSSKLNIKNKKSDRILDICNHFGSKYYITGMGGLDYLNREKFIPFNNQNPDISYKLSEDQGYSQISQSTYQIQLLKEFDHKN